MGCYSLQILNICSSWPSSYFHKVPTYLRWLWVILPQVAQYVVVEQVIKARNDSSHLLSPSFWQGVLVNSLPLRVLSCISACKIFLRVWQAVVDVAGEEWMNIGKYASSTPFLESLTSLQKF